MVYCILQRNNNGIGQGFSLFGNNFISIRGLFCPTPDIRLKITIFAFTKRAKRFKFIVFFAFFWSKSILLIYYQRMDPTHQFQLEIEFGQLTYDLMCQALLPRKSNGPYLCVCKVRSLKRIDFSLLLFFVVVLNIRLPDC